MPDARTCSSWVFLTCTPAPTMSGRRWWPDLAGAEGTDPRGLRAAWPTARHHAPSAPRRAARADRPRPGRGGGGVRAGGQDEAPEVPGRSEALPLSFSGAAVLGPLGEPFTGVGRDRGGDLAPPRAVTGRRHPPPAPAPVLHVGHERAMRGRLAAASPPGSLPRDPVPVHGPTRPPDPAADHDPDLIEVPDVARPRRPSMRRTSGRRDEGGNRPVVSGFAIVPRGAGRFLRRPLGSGRPAAAISPRSTGSGRSRWPDR